MITQCSCCEKSLVKETKPRSVSVHTPVIIGNTEYYLCLSCAKVYKWAIKRLAEAEEKRRKEDE